MPLTNFPNGIQTPFISGANLPFTGNHYFVDPVNGSDGAEGTVDDPLKTLKRAHDLCIDGNNDVVHLIGNGQTSGTAYLTEQLVWSKNACHLVGICSPTKNSQRARIAIASGTTGFSPMVKVTGQGCMFSNISAYHGYATAETQICWLESGQRNYYENVHFAGMGDTGGISGDQTGSASLHIDGGVAAGTSGLGENTFVGCTIGLDTIARSVANANLKLSGATPRNVFKDCNFPAFADNAAVLFVKASAASDLDKETIFDRCRFINCIKSTATTMTAGFSVHASVGGLILMDQCVSVGATDIETNGAPSNNIFIIGPVPTATTTGLAINNA